LEPESNKQQTVYTALYRRWRPQLFSEVVGQNHVTRTLQNALSQNRIAHAYLFCGLRGTGKTTMAKLFAKALNCLEGVNSEPCNHCRSCREVMEGRNMDVLEIDAASNRGIDEIRDLREKARYVAAQNRYKVYIVDEVHMLTNEAFNALLKTLEEPPPNVIFILATTEVHKLPLTVISRCQRFDFHLLEVGQIAERLREVAEELNFSIEKETLYLLARQADGSVRDALGLLEQCKAYGGEKISYSETLEIMGLASPEMIFKLIQSVIEENIASGLAAIREIVYKGRDLHRFLQELILYLRKLLLLQAGGDQDKTLADTPVFKPYLLQHKDHFDQHVLLEMLEILQELTFQLRGTLLPQFLLELTFLRLLRAYRFRFYLSSGEFFNRLQELERRLQSLEGKEGQETSPVKQMAKEEEKEEKVEETVKIEMKVEEKGDFSQAELIQFWEESFLPELKKRRKAPIHALLQVARPISRKEGVFTIALPSFQRVLKPRIESANNKKFIESLLGQLLNEELTLLVVLEENEEQGPGMVKKIEKHNFPGEKREEIKKDNNDFFFRQMLELFNGKLIETCGEPLDTPGFWTFNPTGKEL
jgi:DNA polymerase-3 subunit gamma/tau